MNASEERAQFEAWVATRPGHPFAGRYLDLMWIAWHSALAFQQPPAGAAHHAVLQQIGTALSLPVGSDLNTECVPAIEALREDSAAFLEREFYALDEECRRAGHHGFMLAPAAVPAGWRPIAEAPQGRLCVVGWLDPEDSQAPERHDFDYIEDGCWVGHANRVEHAEAVAPAGSGMPLRDAPYRWFIEVPSMLTAVPEQQS